ncbi:MAG: HD-GYP domain-containing protein [Clostridiaceae bacterium]|nr:HD-GYP domain-containing protein [Clostridiaceae bacterium]
MKKNKKALPVNELKIGMIIAEKVYSEQTVLINRGVVVTETIINRLKSKYIYDNIEVFTEEDGEIDFIGLVKEKTVEEIEQTFKALSFNVESIFESISIKGIADIEEIQQFAKKIQGELNSARTIIKDIVLQGSGEDAIYRHSVNVAALSSILGKWLNLDDEEIRDLICAAVLHDFGKTKIDKNILNQAGELNGNISKEMRSHPLLSYNILKSIPNLKSSIAEGVLSHHERLDGSGYPRGLKDDKISAFARIIAIADTFDEFNSTRLHSIAKGPFKGLQLIQQQSFGQLDYEYSKVFLEHLINFYISENVLLNNNNVAKIIQIDINDLERPLLLDDQGFVDLKKKSNISIDKLLL